MSFRYSVEDLQAAAAIVYSHMPPTPQYSWPQLDTLTGCRVRVKHENHTPIGAFKARGAFTFINWLKNEHPESHGIITATRGNHGQAQALAASRYGMSSTILVPEGNSPEKNSAMKALGANLIEFGSDFDQARCEAERIASDKNLFLVPAFHRELVRGVATCALELFQAVQDIDAVYVPIGCGSGVCGVIQARDALQLKTDIIGVVSTEAPAARLSFEQGRLIETDSADTFADGLAVRVPVKQAYEIYSGGLERIVSVTDPEIEEAVRIYYRCTHNLAEGAGAAPLAALLQEREKMSGKSVALILSGGNIDMNVMHRILGVAQI